MRCSSLAIALATVVALCAVPVLGGALAQAPEESGVSRTPDGRSVIHRRVPARPGDEGGEGASSSPVFVYDPVAGGSLPRELQRDGQALERPADDANAKADEAVYSPEGMTPAAEGEVRGGAAGALPSTASPDAGPRSGRHAEGATSPAPGPETRPLEAAPVSEDAIVDPRQGLGDFARPDRATQKEDTLNYGTVFDPAVVPFKRNRALNRIASDFTLRVGSKGFTRLQPIGNRLDRGRELFWGSVLVEGKAGQRIPLPSVSPSSRVLSYETSPEVGVLFEKDEADNYYVTLKRSVRTRLIFVMDAPSTYFARSVPAGLSVSSVPPSLRPRPPAGVRQEASHVLAALNLSPSLPYDRLLNSLVSYFRGFAPGEPPRQSATIYRDLALGRTGVCRHRGYAFVLTAQSLGIPARYVFNEAHVFVEAYVPGPRAGWVRIDLGGGADQLVVHGGLDKTLHRPRGRDPFERPPAYAEQVAGGQTAGATRVSGLPSPGRPNAAATPGPVAPEAYPEVIARMLDKDIQRAAPAPQKRGTKTTLTLDDAIVFRGDKTRVSGRVTDANGRSISGGSVQVLLLFGPQRKAVALLATSRLDRGGRFEADIRVPADQPPGAYEIVAEFRGTTTYAPSVSD